MHLRKREVGILQRNLFRSHAHLVPNRDTANGDTCSGNLGTAAADLWIPINETSNLYNR